MKKRYPFTDSAVEAVFNAYPAELRGDLLRLRELILKTAGESEAVGQLVESLKWGQAAYRPEKPKVGTTVRIGTLKNRPREYAMFFHCQTTLVADFRTFFSAQFDFEDNRALTFTQGQKLPLDPLRHCISLALTYHTRK